MFSSKDLSTSPLLGKEKRTSTAKVAIVLVALCLGLAATCISFIYVHTVSQRVSLQGDASIPIPLDSDSAVPLSDTKASLAVAALMKLLLSPSRVSNGGNKFQVSSSPQLSQESQFVVISGKRYLRTTLLDAIWDYHESSEAKDLVNQAIEEQTIDEQNGGYVVPPEAMAADALDRLKAGDLQFEEKWATGVDIHVASKAVDVGKWEANLAMLQRDATYLEGVYEAALSNLTAAQGVLSELRAQWQEKVSAVSAAEATVLQLQNAVTTATQAKTTTEAAFQTATAEEAAAQAALAQAQAALEAGQLDVNVTGLEMTQLYSAVSDAQQALSEKQQAVTDAQDAATAAAAELTTAEEALSTGETALDAARSEETAAEAQIPPQEEVVAVLEADVPPKQAAAESARHTVDTAETKRSGAETAAHHAAVVEGWNGALGMPASVNSDGSTPPRTWAHLWS